MRIGIAGAGRIGEVHLRTLANHPAVAEVLLYDPDAERSRALTQEHGAQLCRSVEELLSSIDALVIASPTPTHVDLLDGALERALPTFCEKPVAEQLAQVEELAERAARIGCPVQVGFHYRFDPVLRELAVRAAGTGPRLLRVHSTTEFAPSADYLARAGGLVADKLVHELDMVRWLTGAEVVRVAALPAGGAADGPASGTVISAALTLELDDGGLASIWGGYRSAAGFDLSVELETAGEVRVVGNRRQVSDAQVTVEPSAVADFRDRFAEAYRAELHAFFALAAGHGPNPCDLSEAVRTQRLVAAAQLAMDERRVVSLVDLPAATGVSA